MISSVFGKLKDQYGYEEKYVSELLKLPLSITIDSKLRILHFIILNNLIPLNTWLVRIGRKDDIVGVHFAMKTKRHWCIYLLNVQKLGNFGMR